MSSMYLPKGYAMSLQAPGCVVLEQWQPVDWYNTSMKGGRKGKEVRSSTVWMMGGYWVCFSITD